MTAPPQDLPQPGARPPVALIEPRDGVPPVITDSAGLASALSTLAAGSGPVAVDAERASGYRYGQAVYLVQLRRHDVGTLLIDPVEVPDLSAVGAAIGDAEWVLHAASQDLPCLALVGMRPKRLFDTELAGRLLGYARVGLGTMVEEVLGYTLEKGHSAVDWSTRPLPDPWLRYAALDVELLVELRDALAGQLDEQGKRAWAEEEFAAIAAAPPTVPRAEPWRRTSGLHRIRKRQQLAIARSLWQARDQMARRRDVAPGRVLPDAAIIEAALAAPATEPDLLSVPAFNGRMLRRHVGTWFGAIEAARTLREDEWPEVKAVHDGPPPARSWTERDPEAASRLAALRAVLVALAAQHQLPTENLLAPDSVRRLAWSPPAIGDEEAVADALRATGARRWQVELTARPLAAALRTAAEPHGTEGSI